MTLSSRFDQYVKINYVNLGNALSLATSSPTNEKDDNYAGKIFLINILGFFSIFLTDQNIGNATVIPTTTTLNSTHQIPTAMTTYFSTITNKLGFVMQHSYAAPAIQTHWYGLKSGVTNGLTTTNNYPTITNANSMLDLGLTFYVRFTNTGNNFSILLYDSAGRFLATVFSAQTVTWSDPLYLAIVQRFSTSALTTAGTPPRAQYLDTNLSIQFMSALDFITDTYSYNCPLNTSNSLGTYFFSTYNPSTTSFMYYTTGIDNTPNTTSNYVYKIYIASIIPVQYGVIVTTQSNVGTNSTAFYANNMSTFISTFTNTVGLAIGTSGFYYYNGGPNNPLTTYAAIGDWIYFIVSVTRGTTNSLVNMSVYNSRIGATTGYITNVSIAGLTTNLLFGGIGASGQNFGARVPSILY
jgi:hypothetical protein